jgi:hypothetical protein
LEVAGKFNMNFADSFVATVKGSCHTPDIKYKNIHAKIFDLKITNRSDFKESLKVKVGLVVNKEGKVKKAPLAFYIPGAFSNREIKQTRRYMDFFTKKGYHSITFVNPWGTDFVKADPYNKIGDVQKEGEVMYRLLRAAYSFMLDNDYIKGQTRLVGVSYGAFVVSMVTALNAEHRNPLNLKDSTLISTPINLGESIKRLDSLIKNNTHYIGLNIINLAYKFTRICWTDSDEDIDDKKLKIAKGLAINQGFFEELVKSVRLYDERNNINKIPGNEDGWSSDIFKKWKLNFTFSKYFESYAPELTVKINTKYSDLYYWINRSRHAGFNKTRIVNATNDFLNDPKHLRKRSDTIILPRGGHYGFRHLKWYDQFLNTIF